MLNFLTNLQENINQTSFKGLTTTPKRANVDYLPFDIFHADNAVMYSHFKH